MASQRKIIRNAVINALKAGGTVAGTRVFGNRSRPVFAKEIPCIIVYTKNEPVEESGSGPREYKRSLALAIELLSQAADEDTLDDVLDDFADQVETIMFADETFGGVASDTVLGETESDILTDGEKPTGVLKINFTLPYYDRKPADSQGSGLDDFKTADIKFDVAPKDGQIESEDTINIPQ
jgi:hypothetical protein